VTGPWIDAVAVMEAADAEAFERALERHVSGLDVTYWKRECSGAAPLTVLGLELRDAGVLRRLEEALDSERPSFKGQRPALIPV
jgi:hypothetical protein